VLDPKRPARSFKVVRGPRSAGLAGQPFEPAAAPIELRVQARRIPDWKQDALGLVGKLPLSPVRSNEPVESITLIPMGAARLRITSFPVIASGKIAE